jgi:hypothetical protein
MDGSADDAQAHGKAGAQEDGSGRSASGTRDHRSGGQVRRGKRFSGAVGATCDRVSGSTA